MQKFLFMPRFIPKQTFSSAKRNPNCRPFFHFILGGSIACWFILFRHWYCVQCYLFALCILYVCVTIATVFWRKVDQSCLLWIVYGYYGYTAQKSPNKFLQSTKRDFHSEFYCLSPFTSFKKIYYDRFDNVGFLITVFL